MADIGIKAIKQMDMWDILAWSTGENKTLTIEENNRIYSILAGNTDSLDSNAEELISDKDNKVKGESTENILNNFKKPEEIGMNKTDSGTLLGSADSSIGGLTKDLSWSSKAETVSSVSEGRLFSDKNIPLRNDLQKSGERKWCSEITELADQKQELGLNCGKTLNNEALHNQNILKFFSEEELEKYPQIIPILNDSFPVLSISDAEVNSEYLYLSEKIQTFLETEPLTEAYKEMPLKSQEILSKINSCKTADETNALLDECIKMKKEVFTFENKFPLMKAFNDILFAWFEYLNSMGHFVHADPLNSRVKIAGSRLDELGCMTKDIYYSGGVLAVKTEKTKKQGLHINNIVEQIQTINVENGFSRTNKESICKVAGINDFVDDQMEEIEELIEDTGQNIKDCEQFKNLQELIRKLLSYGPLGILIRNMVESLGGLIAKAGFADECLLSSMASIPDVPLDMDNPLYCCHANADDINKSMDGLEEELLECTDFADPKNLAKLDAVNSNLTGINSQLEGVCSARTEKFNSKADSFSKSIDGAGNEFDSALNKLTPPDKLNALQNFDPKMDNATALLNDINNVIKAAASTVSLSMATEELCSVSSDIMDLALCALIIPANFIPICNLPLLNKLYSLNNIPPNFNPLNDLMKKYSDIAKFDVDNLKSKMNKYMNISPKLLEDKLNAFQKKLDSFNELYRNCPYCEEKLNEINANFNKLKSVNMPKVNSPVNIKADYLKDMNLARVNIVNFGYNSNVVNLYNSAFNLMTQIAANVTVLANVPFPDKVKCCDCLTTSLAALKDQKPKADKAQLVCGVASTKGILKCDKGLMPIPYIIMPTMQEFGKGLWIGGVLLPTLIPAFGGCSHSSNSLAACTCYIPPYICTGGILHGPFSPGAKTVTVVEATTKALTEECTAPCFIAAGGEIGIDNPGQDGTKYTK
jgi:hypothetical protein